MSLESLISLGSVPTIPCVPSLHLAIKVQQRSPGLLPDPDCGGTQLHTHTPWCSSSRSLLCCTNCSTLTIFYTSLACF